MKDGGIVRILIGIVGILLIFYGTGLKRHLRGIRRGDIQEDITTELVKRQFRFKRCNTCNFYGSLLITAAVISWLLQ